MTFRGGQVDPFIVHWPGGIKALEGRLRAPYPASSTWCRRCSIPLGIDAPATIKGVPQSPIQGVSFAHTFDDADVSTKHHTQYFEMIGHRSIYHDGWRAVCPWPGPSFAEAAQPFGTDITADMLSELDADRLGAVSRRRGLRRDRQRRGRQPRRLIAMIAMWYVEAGKYDVMPVDGSALHALARRAAAPRGASAIDTCTSPTRSRFRISLRRNC